MSEFKCILTGQDVKIERYTNFIGYSLKVAEKEVKVFICSQCKSEISISTPSHIIKGLIANGKWPDRSFVVSSSHADGFPPPVDSVTLVVEDYLSTIYFPKNAGERLDNLLLNLFKLQKEDGQRITINLQDDKFYTINYFQSSTECFFYLKGLEESGLIRLIDNGNGLTNVALTITHAGLNKVVELSLEGINSNECFIAMAFLEETKIVREAIKRALSKTGFKFIFIDEEHLSSDKSIPDGIFASIKKAKFCISDFSFHRHGVYFESGFALGLGKPVIYLCSEAEFPNAHFDIKQLQQIIYKSAEELEGKLVDKIEAWIKV